MPADEHLQFTSSPEQWGNLKLRAQELRHQPTAAENALWRRIRNRQVGGAKFRRQHTVEGFIVDFVCIEQRLILEVDGEIHNTIDQQAYDREREAILEGHGFSIIRFTNDEVLHSTDSVVARIIETLERLRG
jgi:very-short-patch-repair endonuclease